MRVRFLAATAAMLLVTACSGGNPTVPQLRPVEGGWVSSAFGSRPVHPIKGPTPGGHHDGDDFAVAQGSPIRASMAGTVTFAGWKGGYGKAVMLTHPDGYVTLYGHASAIDVAVGQAVEQGQVIARVGSTGLSTGPHLHYELRHHGVAVDPGFFEAGAVSRVADVAPPARRVTFRRTMALLRLPTHAVAGFAPLVPDTLPARSAP